MKITANPNEAGSFDRACRMAMSGDCICLERGVYMTRGNWAFDNYRTLRRGVRVEAVGATILMDPAFERSAAGVVRPDCDINLLWGDGDNEIVGGTWDGNYSALDPQWYVGGLRFSGKFAIRDATVMGLRGSYNSGTPCKEVEVFAISSEGDANGSVIHQCVVEKCCDNAYVTGIVPGATVQSGRVSVVTGCVCRMGNKNRTGFSAAGNVHFRECTSLSGQNGFYVDTWGCSVVLENCVLDGSYAGIGSVGVDPATRHLIAIGCKIVAPRAVEWWDKTDSMNGSVTVATSKIDSEWLAAVSAKRGNLIFAANSMSKPVKFAITSGSQTPTVVP